MKAIQVLFDEPLLRRLDADEEVRKLGRSAVLRRAATEYLRKRRAKRDAPKDRRPSFSPDGRRIAFQADSAGETMAAILKEDPPDPSVTNQSISPGLERIVRHCIEKNPERRFHSAHDLAFDLEALSGTSGLSAAPAGAVLRSRRLRRLALVGALGALLVAGAFWAGKWRAGAAATSAASAPVNHRRLTFHRGNVLFAASPRTGRPSSTAPRGAAAPPRSSSRAWAAPSRGRWAFPARTSSRCPRRASSRSS
ncbi:MAG: hypothetical protein WEF99_07715 [Thermoanaerobaculia bacterium]